MRVRRELTFSYGLRAIGRWWWTVLLCILIVTAGAYLVGGRSVRDSYRADARLHVVNTLVAYDAQGDAVPEAVIPRFAGDVNPQEFLVQEAAAEAAAALPPPRPAPERLLARIGVVPISATEVDFFYTAASPAVATGVLETYVDAYVTRTREQQERALSQALASVRGALRALRAGEPAGVATPASEPARVARRLELEAHADRLKLALDLIPQQVARVGAVEANRERRGLSPSFALAGGAGAGLAVGLLLALLLVRFDPRVRSRSDLDIPGMRIIEIESGQSRASMQRLRSELEVTGLGRDLSVLVVTAATRAESRTGVALGLAEAFASAGTQTALLSADLCAPVNGENVVPLLKSGVSTFLDGEDHQLVAGEVATNLVWVPKGESQTGVELRISSAQVDQLLTEARELGHVVIVDGPPALDSGGLLFVAAADATLMVVQKTRTKWSTLEAALERLMSARRGPVQICFDRSSGRVGRSEPEQGPSQDHVTMSSTGAVGP